MSLTWGGIKRLVRLQAVAQELAVIVREDEDQARGFGTRLFSDLIGETQNVLQDADADLAEEFERIVGGRTETRVPLEARAGILAGWLDGVVAAETLEVRIRTGVGGGRPIRSSIRDNGG